MAITNVRPGLTTGQLGATIGVSADTIRHYEKLGLLKKAVRSDGGYRLYDTSVITRVQTIRSAVKAGFTLAELSGILRERDAGGVPCHRVAGMAAEKVESLEKQIRELTELKDWLALTVNAWRTRLERCFIAATWVRSSTKSCGITSTGRSPTIWRAAWARKRPASPRCGREAPPRVGLDGARATD